LGRGEFDLERPAPRSEIDRARKACLPSITCAFQYLRSVLPEPPQIALADSHAGSVEELEDLYRKFSSGADAIAESRGGDLAVLTALGEKICG